MTQPTSINMTFDTSLVDVNPPPRIEHMPTRDTYNQWASVYDTDGNMLQAIDDVELATRLPDFLSQVLRSMAHNGGMQEVRVLDVGCGTGRTTAKLVQYNWHGQAKHVHVTGIDFSQAMLDVARTKLTREKLHQGGAEESRAKVRWRLECGDVFSPPLAFSLEPQHAIVSTLVLEHVPLATFLSTVASLLVVGGMALITNMHADMGRTSQAGFVNANGVKIRGQSFVYTVQETVQSAKESGFEVLGTWEREVTREHVDEKGANIGERGKKWVGIKVWYGLVIRKVR
ncbi:hypothetical protein ACJQWK_10147 [Exserohilum turcicum]